MTEFIYKGLAQLRHLNVRKEGPEDDKTLVVDVKFRGRIDATLCSYFDEKLHDFLFTDGTIVRSPMMDAIGFSNSIEHCELEALEQRFYGVSLHKFKVRPIDGGQIELDFTATFMPDNSEVAVLAEYVLEEIRIEARPEPALNFGGEQTEAA